MANRGIVGILRTLVTVDPSGFTAGMRTASVSATGFGVTLDKLKGHVAGAADGLIDITGILSRAGTGLSDFGKSLTFGVSLPLLGAGGVALKFASDFQASTTKLGTLSDVAVGQVDNMRASILALAPTVGVGPQALSEALLVVTSTGLRGAEALQVLEHAAKASAIGLGETRDIARAVTAAMNAYSAEGLTASQATDVLVQSVVEGGAEADQLAGSIGRVVGLAAQMGVSFAQTGAFIATFSRLGVDADEAVTALRGTLSNILNPAAQVVKALGTVGLTADDLRAAIRDRGLADTLLDLVARFRGNEEALGDVIPNVRALSGVLGTAGAQGDAFREVLENIENSMGVTDRKFGETTKTMAFGLAQLRARIEALAVSFGTQLAPAFNVILSAAKPLLDAAAGLVRAFAALPQPIQTVTLAVFGLAAVAGPLLIVLGSLVRTLAIFATLSGINTLLNILTGTASAATVASAGLSGAVAALVGWITRAAAPVVAFGKQFLTVGTAFRTVWGIIAGGSALLLRAASLLTLLIPGGWLARMALVALSFASVRGVIADLVSIVLSATRVLLAFGHGAIDAVSTAVAGFIGRLRELWAWAEKNIPGFAALTAGVAEARDGLHSAAVAFDAYADAAGRAATENASLLDQASKTSAAAKSMRQFWADAASGGIKPAADASMLLSMQLGDLGQVVNDQTANALAKLTRELNDARIAAGKLADWQKTYLTTAIREGSTSIENMATNAQTTTGAVKLFKAELEKAAAATDKAAAALKSLRDELGGVDVLATARTYTQALASIGGVSKLTAAEQEKYLTALDEVVAKYQRLGPAGAAVVRHFETQRTALRGAIAETARSVNAQQAQAEALAETAGVTLDVVAAQRNLGLSDAALAAAAGITIEQFTRYVAKLEEVRGVTDELTAARETLWSSMTKGQVEAIDLGEDAALRDLQRQFDQRLVDARTFASKRADVERDAAAARFALQVSAHQREETNELRAFQDRVERGDLFHAGRATREALYNAIVARYANERVGIYEAEGDRAVAATAASLALRLQLEDAAALDFMRADQARLDALKGTAQEDPFSKWADRAREARDRMVETWKGVGAQLSSAITGNIGTLLFGGLGHDVTGELRAAADEAHLDFLRIQRSGKKTAEELRIAFERWRDAEDRANFSFAERFGQLWGGVKQTIVRVLDDILGHFVRHFIGGMLRAIGAAKLGQTLGSALMGGATAGVGGLVGGGASAAASVAGVEAAALGGGGGGAGAAGFLSNPAFWSNPYTIAGVGAAALLTWGITKKGWFRGGEEANVNPLRDQFTAQFGGQDRLAARLSKLTGEPGGGRSFSALQKADDLKEFRSAEQRIADLFGTLGIRVKMFNRGGFVQPGAVVPAMLHGGQHGEVVQPLGPQGQGRQMTNVNFYVSTLDATDFNRVFDERIIPKLHMELRLNRQGTLTLINQVTR